jgi:prepilin-type N-terminal cleavage/methylation domain-containing protein
MSRADRRRQRGLTLIELLVSLLILGFVLALVSQAIYQVAQVARAAQEVTASLATRWTGGTAAAPVIANLALPLEAPEGKAFEGNTTRLAGFSTQPPTPSDVGVRAFVLELRRPRDGSRGSELWAVEGDTLTSAATETVLARFDARAEFVYADDAGELRPFWPFEPLTPGRETRELPAAVVVRDSATRNALAWYGFQGESVRQRPLSNPFATAAP